MNILNIAGLSDKIKTKQPIVLFDGECSLCSSSVRFLIKHNKKGNLNFASLKSEDGLMILRNGGKGVLQSDTLLFLENNSLYSYSTAAIKITAHLAYPWRMLGVFTIIPAAIRDLFYKVIAKNRYKWFGRKSYCMTDIQGNQSRFLS